MLCKVGEHAHTVRGSGRRHRRRRRDVVAGGGRWLAGVGRRRVRSRYGPWFGMLRSLTGCSAKTNAAVTTGAWSGQRGGGHGRRGGRRRPHAATTIRVHGLEEKKRGGDLLTLQRSYGREDGRRGRSDGGVRWRQRTRAALRQTGTELQEATKTKTRCKGGSLSVGCSTREKNERERGGPSPATSFSSGGGKQRRRRWWVLVLGRGRESVRDRKGRNEGDARVLYG
jgi:hypothetical protein